MHAHASDLGGDPHPKQQSVSSEELWDMVAESDMLEEHSRNILNDVFGAADRSLQEVMHPRTEVAFIDGTLSIAAARGMVREGPFSRYPVIGRTPDDVLGYIHIRDLMPRDGEYEEMAVKEIVREILPLPGTNRVLSSLVSVVNGSVDVDGGLILQEFASVTGIALPDGHYETVAGFVMDRLGRLPRIGDRAEVPGHVLTVVAMDGLRIARIRVTPVNERPLEL